MGRIAAQLADKENARSRDRKRAGKQQRTVVPLLPGNRVLIIVQNLSVPWDRRVWLECQALVSAGHQVAVICPKDDGDPAYEVLDGVELYKYRGYAPGGYNLSYVAEYAYSLAATAWLTLKARRRSGRFDVLQACNPPDIFWPIARVLRAIDHTRFVFDHHDLSPELFESRFPNGPKLPYKALLAMERWTYRTADHVILPNDSYREIAITRGGKSPANVSVVRTGPDPERLKRGPEFPELRRGRRFLAAYIGVMGPQDGVDILVRAADIVINKLGRDDIAFTVMGSGDCLNDLIALRDELGLADHVEFTGRVPDEVLARVLSTADVGLSPDPKNPLNDLSTMNKSMEYMAFELPVVAFDLRETRGPCGNAAVYVTPNDEYQYAEAIVALMDDEPRRYHMGKLGRTRVEQNLGWPHQQRTYLGWYLRGVQHFVDDDLGYLDWLSHHPDRFVINTTRRPSKSYLMLHRANCRTIGPLQAGAGTFTGDCSKLCGSRVQLEAYARRLGGTAQVCRDCL
jgi:glycosyltransferase involved in cell wall biosynthesis